MGKRKAWSIGAVALLLTLGLAACGGGAGESAADSTGGATGQPTENTQEKETITFGFTPWTTTYPGTYVAKHLIEEHLGYEVELRDADVGVIYQGIGAGDIDVFMDNWELLHTDYMASLGDKVEDLGVIYQNAVTGWAVPDYVDPGLKSIADLNTYKDLFDAKVTGIDPGAGMSATSLQVIEEYGLDYEYVASSEAAMLTALESATRKQEPILFLVYRPHSMFAKYDIRVLEDPKGIWKADRVHVVASSTLKERAPEVREFLQRFKMPIDDYEAWIAAQDGGADPDELAKKWIEEHPDQVKAMLGN